jgi:hypothetical protein
MQAMREFARFLENEGNNWGHLRIYTLADAAATLPAARAAGGTDRVQGSGFRVQWSVVRHRRPRAGGAMTGELQGAAPNAPPSFLSCLDRRQQSRQDKNERVLRAGSGSCQSAFRRGKPGGDGLRRPLTPGPSPARGEGEMLGGG